jgi:Fe-S cluster biogenesis protein NfuA
MFKAMTTRYQMIKDAVQNESYIPSDFETYNQQVRSKFQGRPLELFLKTKRQGYVEVLVDGFIIGELSLEAHILLQTALNLCCKRNLNQIPEFSLREAESFLRHENQLPHPELISVILPLNATWIDLRHKIFLQASISDENKDILEEKLISPDFDFSQANYTQRLQAVITVLNAKMKQRVLLEGGDFKVINIVDNTVVVSLLGRCQTCSSGRSHTLNSMQYHLRQNLGSTDVQVVEE